jgi:hypothetical protein
MLCVTPSKTAAHFGSASSSWLQCSTHCSAGCRTAMTRRPADYEIEGPAEPTVVAPKQAHRAT